MAETIRVDIDEGVHRITLDRSEKRNAMNQQMVRELGQALGQAECDGARLVVLRGSGGHFCAGGDVADMAQARSTPGPDGEPDSIVAFSEEFGRLALRYARTPVPLLAVLEGSVMGGGFGLACTADVVIAATSTVFRLPETGLGVVPAQIAPFLIERLGYSEAKRLAVTGGKLEAPQALALGLVHEVAEPDALQSRVAATMGQLLRGGPQATRATKELFHRLHPGVDERGIRHAAEVFAAAARSPEAMEGMTAFLSKRSASWVP